MVCFQILVTCLQRNYGLGDTHIHQELKSGLPINIVARTYEI